jgi:ABC-2 type transport system permease protein
MSQAAEALTRPVPLPPTAPSAGDRRRRFWFIVWVSAVAQYRRRYAGTVLGYVWTVLQPLLLFVVIYAVFTEVIRFGDDIEGFGSFLLANIIFFFFFRRATITAMKSFVSRRSIVANVKVPPLTMPLAAILAATFVFLMNLAVSLLLAIAFGTSVIATWLLIPVLIVYIELINIACGVLLASSFVRVRDVVHVWTPITRLLFYVSGAIFPFALIPDGFFKDVAAINPLSPLFVQLRVWLIDNSAPNWSESAGSTVAVFLPFITLALIGIAAVLVYRRTRSSIAEGL